MLNTVKLTREDIRQVKYEKAELERTLRLRKQSSDKVINDLQQQLDDEKVYQYHRIGLYLMFTFQSIEITRTSIEKSDRIAGIGCCPRALAALASRSEYPGTAKGAAIVYGKRSTTANE